MVAPGFSLPFRSAAWIMFSAMRSFTLPAGFIDSTLARISADPAGTTRFNRTIGVPPTRSSTVSAIPFSLVISLLDVVPGTTGLHQPLAVRQVGDRGVVQDSQYRLPHRLPHLPLQATAVLAALAAVVQTIDQHFQAFQRLQYLAHTQLARFPDEGVAPLRAAHAANEAGPA